MSANAKQWLISAVVYGPIWLAALIISPDDWMKRLGIYFCLATAVYMSRYFERVR